MSTSNASALQMDVNDVQLAVVRAAGRNNLLYPFSALLMLIGCYLISMPYLFEFRQLSGLLMLLGVINVYETMVILTFAYVVRRLPESREAPVLLFIELLFLVDATFTINACVAVSAVGGAITVAVSLLAAYMKIAGLHLLSRVRVVDGIAVFLLPALGFVYLFQVVFVAFLGAPDAYREVSTFAVFVGAGALLFLLGKVELEPVRGEAEDVDEEPSPKWLGGTWRKTAIVVTLVALAAQLAGQSWVHTVPLAATFLLPVVFTALAVWPRPVEPEGGASRKAQRHLDESQLARVIIAVLTLVLGTVLSGGMSWSITDSGLLPILSPFRIGLLYGAGIFVYMWRRERAQAFFDLAFLVLVIALLGHDATHALTRLFEPTVVTMVAYAAIATAWLLTKRSYRRVLTASTPLLVMAVATIARVTWADDGLLQFFRYWSLMAFAIGFVIESRDRSLRKALAFVIFAAGVVSADASSVSGIVYASLVLAAFLTSAFVERRGYGVVAGCYLTACLMRACALELPETSVGWGILTVVIAFILFACGIVLTRLRMRQAALERTPPPVALKSDRPDPLVRGMCVVAIVGLLLVQILPGPCCGPAQRIASNETSAVASLVIILCGQATFHKTDFYGNGQLVYANARDGTGIRDLYEVPNGRTLGLIDKSLFNAFDADTPKAGYRFASLEGDADGGPYDPAIEFAVCAVPTTYDVSGRNVFVMDIGGTVCQIDAAELYTKIRRGDPVPPLTLYPSAAELDTKWIAVGN